MASTSDFDHKMELSTSQKALTAAVLCFVSPYIAAVLSQVSIVQRVAAAILVYVAVSAQLQQRSANRFRVARETLAVSGTLRDVSYAKSAARHPTNSSSHSTLAKPQRFAKSTSPSSSTTGEDSVARSVARTRIDECTQLADACYLDAAAAPPFPSGLVRAVADDLSNKLLSNPHSKSPSAISTADQISSIRLRVMHELFGIQDTHNWHLVFTSGATASLKLVGESFDWAALASSAKGRAGFAYLLESHTSAVGIRDLAARGGVASSTFTGNELIDVAEEGLVVLPLQCNATGTRYVDLIKRVCRSRGEKGLTMVDAASYLSSSQRLDLSQFAAEETPDMIAFSFYKIFGYPTGLGGLLVKASAAPQLHHKTYYGGGTVDSILSETRWTKPRKDFEASLEDGTVNIHGILAVDKAIDYYREAFGSWDFRRDYVADLRSKLVRALQSLSHGNGHPVLRIYSGSGDHRSFGPIINFNVLTADGSIVPPQEVDRLASISNIHLRMGRHCNPGFVTSQLGVSADQLKQEYAEGVGCDDAGDAGSFAVSASLRASLCLLNTDEDIERLVGFIARFFLSTSPTSSQERVKGIGSKDDAERDFELANITVYPIKSCSGQNLLRGEKWELTRHGLEFDREWIVMNLANGKALSQKRFPKMALIRPQINLRARTMHICIAGTSKSFTLPLDDESQYTSNAADTPNAKICGVEVRPRAHNSALLRSMLTDLLGVSCTLARQATSVSRHSKLDAGTDKIPLIFSNESPFLLINSASVDRVSEWIQQDTSANSSGVEEVASDSGYSSTTHVEDKHKQGALRAQAASFRANFLLSSADGTGAAFAEDGFSRVVFGGKHVFGVLGECRRCQMVCVDQQTGEVRPQTLKTLAKHRRNARGRIIFGSHLSWLPDLKPGAASSAEEGAAQVWVGMPVVAT